MEYRTFYSGNEDGKRQQGVGIYMHIAVTLGEFDIQPDDMGLRVDLRNK